MRWRLRWRREREKELDDELAFDLAAETEERMRAGISREVAAEEARRDFGNAVLIREDVREMWGSRQLARFGQDLRYGVRSLRKSPLFATMAVLSLGLGIGSATAIYSVMDAVLYRALPVREPRELTILNWRAIGPPAAGFREPEGVDTVDGSVRTGPGGERLSADFPWPFFASMREGTPVFSTVFAYKDAGQLTVWTGGHAELSEVQFVSGNYFEALGVQPAVGRLIEENDSAAAVLSYNYWRDRYGADRGAVGRAVRIGGLPFTIEGVAAPEFFGLAPGSSPGFFLPMGMRPRVISDSTAGQSERISMFTNARYYWADLMGRLRPGVTLAEAEAKTAARLQQFLTAAGANPARADAPRLGLEEGGSGLDSLRRQFSKPLFVLMAMTALILLIACANIASLLLARAVTRQREMAVRLSLGASRGRVLRQLLTESLLLAAPGCALGLGVAALGVRFLVWLMSGGRGGLELQPGFGWRVPAFAIATAATTVVLFGLAPALAATRVEVGRALKGARGHTGPLRGTGVRRALAAAQTALSFLLVLGAILFVRTLSNLHAVELGFETKSVLTFDLNASKAGYRGERLSAFYGRIEDRLRSVPGVRDVTATAAPLGRRFYRTPALFGGNRKGFAGWNAVGATFFQTMGIPILLGRALDSRDVKGSAPAAVVNEAFANAWFAGRSPVGEHMGILDGGKDVTIVGVAGNARESVKEPFGPFVYISYRQFTAPEWRGMSFEVRAKGDPLALAAETERALHEAAPDVPVANMSTQAERLENLLTQERIFAQLCTAFAVLALTIASIGLYGSMAYAVSRRTGEIGIRMALGARGRSVVAMVMREVAALTAAGLAAGVVCGGLLLPAVKAFLFGVKMGDPGTIGLAAGVMGLASLLAGYGPARRASRVDPVKALRHE